MSTTNSFNFLGGLILEIGAVIAVLALLHPIKSDAVSSTFTQPPRNAVFYGSEPLPARNFTTFRPSPDEFQPAVNPPTVRPEPHHLLPVPQANARSNERYLPPVPANRAPRTAEAQPRIRNEFDPPVPSYRISDAHTESYYDRY